MVSVAGSRGDAIPSKTENFQLLIIVISSLQVISFDFQLRSYIGTIAELMPKIKVIISIIPSLSKSLVRILFV